MMRTLRWITLTVVVLFVLWVLAMAAGQEVANCEAKGGRLISGAWRGVCVKEIP